MRTNIVSLVVVSLAAAGTVLSEPIRTPYRPAVDRAVSSWLDRSLPGLVKSYKHLHAHPELSLEEQRTAALLADGLASSGYVVTTGVGGTGVVGVLRNGEGPTLLIRGDMDALPIVEETGLDYASKVTVVREDGSTVGVMHACGHDVHTIVLSGTARLLAEMRDRWRGTVVVIGQPA
ncbi:MAG: M20/M25/M40 family metallo-hydrolase, partial [Planctomycetes bacterium]|nr:M20/M25/M40 family metallo-hydrolase [Planctomycetota bacterium]